MNKETAFNYLRLRIIVGALGEKSTPRWWHTNFLNETSGTFLNHIFMRTRQAAQYHGIREAACKIHDNFIGVGAVYHLFRLPEEIEHDLNNLMLIEGNKLEEIYLQTKDSNQALDKLSEMAGGNKEFSIGPIFVGKTNLLTKTSNINSLARLYNGAFAENNKTFPYFSD